MKSSSACSASRLVGRVAVIFLMLLYFFPGWAMPTEDPEAAPDWAGMRRDLYSLIGWQVVATAIIYHAPEEYSNWSDAEKDNLGFEQWRDNMTDLEWDKDHWAINYILHPYWGAGYYVRGRERGFSRVGSFWVAVLYSSVYEFGVESFLEQPSIQDIIVTPLVGSVLGIWFDDIRSRIRSRGGEPSWCDRFVLGATDPLGTLNRAVASLFPSSTNGSSELFVSVRPLIALPVPSGERPFARPYAGDVQGNIDGIELTFRYRW